MSSYIHYQPLVHYQASSTPEDCQDKSRRSSKKRRKIQFDLSKNRTYIFESGFTPQPITVVMSSHQTPPRLQRPTSADQLVVVRQDPMAAMTTPKFIQPQATVTHIDDVQFLNHNFEMGTTAPLPIVITSSSSNIYFCSLRCDMCSIM